MFQDPRSALRRVAKYKSDWSLHFMLKQARDFSCQPGHFASRVSFQPLSCHNCGQLCSSHNECPCAAHTLRCLTIPACPKTRHRDLLGRVPLPAAMCPLLSSSSHCMSRTTPCQTPRLGLATGHSLPPLRPG